MKYRYTLAPHLEAQAVAFEEFANGAAQASARLRDGRLFGGLLISQGRYVVAMRDHVDLPFSFDDVEELFQSESDKSPKQRDNWRYWDSWV